MKVESIAECSFGAFCNTFDLHLAIIGLENQFSVFFFSGRLKQVLLYLVGNLKHRFSRGSVYSALFVFWSFATIGTHEQHLHCITCHSGVFKVCVLYVSGGYFVNSLNKASLLRIVFCFSVWNDTFCFCDMKSLPRRLV